jgi:hypothetical protein
MRARRLPLLAFSCSFVGFSHPAGVAEESRSLWIEGGSFRFRLDATRGCGLASLSVNGSTNFRDAAPLLGFLVRVEAKRPAFLVSPRDVTLEADGVVLDPVLAQPENQGRCAPLLSFSRLAAGRVAQGYVLFRVPEGFRASKGPIVLVYGPTRWGGTRRVVAQIPKCLEACNPPSRTARQTKRNPP